jgi:uncharacterized membrane protein
MGDHRETTTVRTAPATLFSYLQDIENLPRYLPYLESARPLGGDRVEVTAKGDPGADAGPDGRVTAEAWMRVVEEGRRLEWGSPGPHDYAGSLDVDAGDDPDEALLTVTLHTERGEDDEIRDGLRSTIDGLTRAVEASAG